MKSNKRIKFIVVGFIVFIAVFSFDVLMNSSILNETISTEIKEASVMGSYNQDGMKLPFLSEESRVDSQITKVLVDDKDYDIESYTIYLSKEPGDTLPVRKNIIKNKLTGKIIVKVLPVLDDRGFAMLD